MSEVVLNKDSQPSTPAANKAELWYDSTDLALKAIDENGNILNVAGLNIKDYRIIKVTHVLQGTVLYTPSADCNALYVECIGGGAAGGGAATSSANCSLGGGGGSGGYSAVWLTGAAVKTSFACVVGAGGTPGAAGAAGGNGNDTTFDSPSVCTAKAGTGGAVLAAGTSLITQSGSSGGTAASGVGDDKFDGSSGGWGVRLSASAGHAGDGGNAPIGGGAVGGASATLTAGSAGKLYGGGGSGAFTATTAQAGGAGANGLIRIIEYA